MRGLMGQNSRGWPGWLLPSGGSWGNPSPCLLLGTVHITWLRLPNPVLFLVLLPCSQHLLLTLLSCRS